MKGIREDSFRKPANSGVAQWQFSSSVALWLDSYACTRVGGCEELSSVPRHMGRLLSLSKVVSSLIIMEMSITWDAVRVQYG